MGVRRGGFAGLLTASIVALVSGSLLAGCGVNPAPEVSPSSAPEHLTLQTLAESELEPATLELHEVVEENEHFTTTAVSYSS
jgi:hypothetical protein